MRSCLTTPRRSHFTHFPLTFYIGTCYTVISSLITSQTCYSVPSEGITHPPVDRKGWLLKVCSLVLQREQRPQSVWIHVDGFQRSPVRVWNTQKAFTPVHYPFLHRLSAWLACSLKPLRVFQWKHSRSRRRIQTWFAKKTEETPGCIRELWKVFIVTLILFSEMPVDPFSIKDLKKKKNSQMLLPFPAHKALSASWFLNTATLTPRVCGKGFLQLWIWLGKKEVRVPPGLKLSLLDVPSEKGYVSNHNKTPRHSLVNC